MFNIIVIIFVFFSDFFVFSNLEVFICFFFFLAFYFSIVFSLGKFYYSALSIFIFKHKPFLIVIFKLLEKFEYFDYSYKLIKFSFRLVNKLSYSKFLLCLLFLYLLIQFALCFYCLGR